MRLSKTPLIISVLAAWCAWAAVAEIQNETAKLFASDGNESGLYGGAVAIDGNIAVIGARNQGGTLTVKGPGAAYLVDLATEQQLFKLTASDGEMGDYFGSTVAISGTTAIVGAPFGYDAMGVQTGAAYLFDVTNGQLLFKLVSDDGVEGDAFGASVAISGTTAVIGAPSVDTSHLSSGAAYIFDTTTGQQIRKLTGQALFFAHFGGAVAIDGQIAVIGSPRHSPSGSLEGAAFVFDLTTGQQLFKLRPTDLAFEDMFGSAVAISGDTALVGSTENDDNGSASGSAYLFSTTTGQQLHKLLPSESTQFDRFGLSVSLDGAIAMVSTQFDGDTQALTGAAYLFDTGTGQELFKLLPASGLMHDWFGSSVAISGDYALVGARGDDGLAESAGAAYLFAAGIPSILVQPQKYVFVDLGADPQVINVDAVGNAPLLYQWRLDGAPISDNAVFSGTATDTLTVDPMLSAEGTYDVVISNHVGQVISNPIGFAVRDPAPLAGDLNGDGVVDTADLGLLINGFETMTP